MLTGKNLGCYWTNDDGDYSVSDNLTLWRSNQSPLQCHWFCKQDLMHISFWLGRHLPPCSYARWLYAHLLHKVKTLLRATWQLYSALLSDSGNWWRSLSHTTRVEWYSYYFLCLNTISLLLIINLDAWVKTADMNLPLKEMSSSAPPPRLNGVACRFTSSQVLSKATQIRYAI